MRIVLQVNKFGSIATVCSLHWISQPVVQSRVANFSCPAVVRPHPAHTTNGWKTSEHWQQEKEVEVFPGQVFSPNKQVRRDRRFFSWSFWFIFTRNKLSEMFWASYRCCLGASWHRGVKDKTKRIERASRKGCLTWNAQGSEKTPQYFFGHGRLDVDRKRLVNYISQVRSCWSWYFRGIDSSNLWREGTDKQNYKVLTLAVSCVFTPTLASSTHSLCTLSTILYHDKDCHIFLGSNYNKGY